MKHTYLTLTILTALALTACSGGSSSDNHNAAKDNETTNSIDDQNNINKDSDRKKNQETSDNSKLESPKLDEVVLDKNNPDQLRRHIKPEGDGSIVVHWGDEKFKAMNSVNPNLSERDLALRVNEDGTRKHLSAKWNEISITPPNTIVGNDNKAKTSIGSPVAKTATLDIVAAQDKTQELNIELEDGSTVTVNYQTNVVNLGKENDTYVAQSVHVFGSEKDKNQPIEMTYVYGVKTPDSFNDIENLPTNVTYQGIATYLKHGETDIKNGTSSFDVEFMGNKATVSNGIINIPDANINYTIDSFDMAGTSFFTPNFTNTGTFIKPTANLPRMRGRFYGSKGQYLGGAFYDSKGAGTFFSGDKERGGEVSAE